MLERYSHDTERLNTTRICECGARKSTMREACERCTFLDGTGGTAQIIDALRGTDGLSANEVSALIGNQFSEGTARALRRLLSIGRVRRYWREPDLRDHTFMVFGTMRTGKRACGNGCWMYQLDAEYAEHEQYVPAPRTDAVLSKEYLRKKARRARRAAGGTCTECTRPVIPGLKICQKHREDAAARYEARKTRAANDNKGAA